jgi:hypothetical protein
MYLQEGTYHKRLLRGAGRAWTLTDAREPGPPNVTVCVECSNDDDVF